MSFAIVVEAVKIVGTAVVEERAERERIARESERFARLLRESNLELARRVEEIVRTGFSENKLNDAQNELDSVTRLYTEHLEHRRRPENFENADGRTLLVRELSEITDSLQRVIDILNDADVQDAGMVAYMTAASLRIAALVLRAEFIGGDAENAKRAAREQYLPHAEFMRDTIWPNLIRRFSEVRVTRHYTPQSSGGLVGDVVDSKCYFTAGFTVDNVTFTDSGTRERINSVECSNLASQARDRMRSLREEKIQDAVRRSPHAAMVEAIGLMRQFANT